MFTDNEISLLKAVAAMSAHHGTYQYLIEGDNWCYLSHRKTGGAVLYEFKPTP